MSEEENKVNLPAVISEFELPKAIGGRALKAVTDLMGNAVDRWAAKLEDNPKKTRAKTVRDINQTDRLDDEITTRLISDDPFMDRMVENKKNQWLREQSNVDTIAQEAVTLLPGLVEEADSVSDADISEDWIHNFRDFSGRVSDKDVQQIWSKLLANEMVKPGSFSLPTLSLLSKIDSQTANMVAKYLSHDGGDRLFVSNINILPNGQETLNLELIELQNLGILTGVSSGISMNIKASNGGKSKLFKIKEGSTQFLFHFESEVSSASVKCVLLTKIGKDLRRLLPMEPIATTVERMKNLCNPPVTKIQFVSKQSGREDISGEV